MAKQCNVCKKPFKNARGILIHKQRNEACGGKKVVWGSTKGRKKRQKLGKSGETGREAIRQILTDHPQGLPLSEIFKQLRSKGFNVHQSYVAQASAGDPTLVRVNRGIYRLKENARRPSGAAMVEEAQTGMTHLPREALLLRIETLETQNRALQDAHLSLIRGVFA